MNLSIDIESLAASRDLPVVAASRDLTVAAAATPLPCLPPPKKARARGQLTCAPPAPSRSPAADATTTPPSRVDGCQASTQWVASRLASSPPCLMKYRDLLSLSWHGSQNSNTKGWAVRPLPAGKWAPY
jgi:hypothetical protein